MIPEFMMTMPSDLANLYVKSYLDIETWKTSMSKKDLVLILYTDSLIGKDNIRIILY